MDLVYSINPQNSYRTAWEEFQKAGHGRHSCKRRLHQELRLCSPRAWENKPQSRGRMCEPHTGTGLWAEWERDSQSTSEDDLIRGRTDTRAVTAEGAQMARDTGQDAVCRSSLGKHALRLRQMSRCTSHRLRGCEGTQRCFVTQHGRHGTGRLLEEGHGSALQSCPLLTACYTWIQMFSKVPCAKAQVLRMGVQWGGGDISLMVCCEVL